MSQERVENADIGFDKTEPPQQAKCFTNGNSKTVKGPFVPKGFTLVSWSCEENITVLSYDGSNENRKKVNRSGSVFGVFAASLFSRIIDGMP